MRDSLGRAQVQVHVEPAALEEERPNERVAAAALRVSGVVEAHNITVLEDAAGRAVTLHVRLPEDATLRQAAEVIERLKREILAEVGNRPRVRPRRAVAARRAAGPRRQRGGARAALAGGGGGARRWRARRARWSSTARGRRLLVVTSLESDPGISVRAAHALASRIEDAVRDALDAVDDVIVEVH